MEMLIINAHPVLLLGIYITIYAVINIGILKLINIILILNT